MSLLCYNFTEDPVTLVGIAPEVVIPGSASPPARGPAVNVTAELAGLTSQQYADLKAQSIETLEFVWTGQAEYDTGDLTTSAQAVGSSVVWAPYASPGSGYYLDWAEALAAAQRLKGPKTIQIMADPDDDNVYIPGGTWDLSEVTLVGLMDDASTDTSYRGWQELLYVTCLGRIGRWTFDDNTPGTISDVTDGIVTFTIGNPWFNQSKYVVGQYIHIDNGQHSENVGDFLITEVVDDYTIKFANGDAIYPDSASGDIDWWIDNPTWLKNCSGLRNMYFRTSDFDQPEVNGSTGTVAEVDGGWVLFTKTGGYHFTSKDIGKPIRIGLVPPYQDGVGDCAHGDNNGTYVIVDVVDGDTIVYFNWNGPSSTDANNGHIYWSLCTSPFIFGDDDNEDPPYVDAMQSTFCLDNVDFRYGGDYNWGSAYVLETGDGGYSQDLFMRLTNGASVRWYSCTVDGYLVIQSDGSPCWLGYDALYGNGYADVFALPGMEVHTGQDIDDWELHGSYTVYIPDNSGNWSGSPATEKEALDRLAAAVVAAGHTP